MAKLRALKDKLKSVPLPVRPQLRDPRTTARIVLGVLLAANAIAAAFAFRPWADSPLKLERDLIGLRKNQITTRTDIEKLKLLVKKSDQARIEGDKFLGTYFLGRRVAASTLASELTGMAKGAGIRPKEHSFGFEPIEGSDSLAMMTITANYEGTYADLVSYVNKLDRSPRFFIMESLAAAPQQGGNGVLNIAIKVNVFVRDDSGAPLLAAKEPPASEKPSAEPEAPKPPPIAPAKVGPPVDKPIQKANVKKGAAQ
ncbi:MAG: hypothetical protein HY820_04010 [Acidobacteria bacterium]|nr:hypothetical protein [Acidobacteriota bacterium]